MPLSQKTEPAKTRQIGQAGQSTKGGEDEEIEGFGSPDCDCAAQVETGAPTAEVTRKQVASQQTYYLRRKKYGQMVVAVIRRLRLLEEENRKLWQLEADLPLDKGMLQEVLTKKL